MIERVIFYYFFKNISASGIGFLRVHKVSSGCDILFQKLAQGPTSVAMSSDNMTVYVGKYRVNGEASANVKIHLPLPRPPLRAAYIG